MLGKGSPKSRSAALVVLVSCLLLGPASAQTESVLHSFCEHIVDQHCLDGETPAGGLVLDSNGNLYGTGGGGTKDGVVFKLTPGGEETVLYNFCSSCGDGSPVLPGLVLDQKGNLYGTASRVGPKTTV